MGKTKVAIVKGNKNPNDKQIDDLVRKAIELTGGLLAKVRAGNTVLIKPNVCADFSPETAVNTDPRVCQTIADMVSEVGAKPVIAESSAIGFDTEKSYQVAGYTDLREKGYDVIDLKKEGIEIVRIPVPKGKAIKTISLPKIVVSADVIISVPKMKTHDQSLVTLALKNMKGVLPDTFKRKFHTTFGVFQSIADLCTVVRPNLSVVDGILAMEGLGPAFGDPLEMDLIIAGEDVVAVDAVTSLVMGFEPTNYGCVHSAVHTGVGIDDLNKIEIVGEPISGVKHRFKRSWEAVEEKVPFPEGFKLIIDEKACTGCRNQVLSSLFEMKEANQLYQATGWHVVSGKIDTVPDISKDRLLLVGACTARFRDKGTFVEGCPPNGRDVTRGMGVNVGVTNIDTLNQ